VRSKGGKYKAYLDQCQGHLSKLFQEEFPGFAEGPVYDVFGNQISGGSLPTETMSDGFGRRPGGLNRWLCVWSTGALLTCHEHTGDFEVSGSGIPYFLSQSAVKTFTVGPGRVNARAFVIRELGCKMRPANSSEFRHVLLQALLRKGIEPYLKTDNRVQLGNAGGFWAYGNQLKCHLAAKMNDDRCSFDIFSEDLTAATDTLNDVITPAIMDGYTSAFNQDSWIRRLVPEVSQPTHVFDTRVGESARSGSNCIRKDEGGAITKLAQFVTQRQGTLLGDGLSMVQLTIHQLVKLEMAAILYSLEWSPGDPFPRLQEYCNIRRVTSPAICSALGDDMISVGPTLFNNILEWLTSAMGDTASIGKAFRSPKINSQYTVSGMYLEEQVDIKLQPGRRPLRVHVTPNNTFKLRLFSEQGRPTGPRDGDKWTSPILGRVQTLAKTCKWILGTDISNIAIQVAWEVTPTLKALRHEGLPVHLPTWVGGLGMPTLPTELSFEDSVITGTAIKPRDELLRQCWLDALDLTAPWIRRLLVKYQGHDARVHAWINPWNDLEAHGIDVNAAFAAYPSMEEIPEPAFTSMEDARLSIQGWIDRADDRAEPFSRWLVENLSIPVTRVDRATGAQVVVPGRFAPGRTSAALNSSSSPLISGTMLKSLLDEAVAQLLVLEGRAPIKKQEPRSVHDWAEEWRIKKLILSDPVDGTATVQEVSRVANFPTDLYKQDDPFGGNYWYLKEDPMVASMIDVRRSYALPTPGYPIRPTGDIASPKYRV
jgi:hypothetical protein